MKFRQFVVPIFVAIALFLPSCAGMDPRNVDVAINAEPPVEKITSFDKALADFGRMILIFGCDIVKVMGYGGKDRTGTSASTGGEIPMETMEMIESEINSIGGNVYLIPSSFELLNQAMTIGMSDFPKKRNPDVILKVGITEFDRALETRGANKDISLESGEIGGLPGWVPARTIGLDYGNLLKTSVANITMDFNLIEFETNTAIQKMQSIVTIQVSKGLAESELAISILGQTGGVKGTIKKVQGRHAAVRLLVQFGVLQCLGRYYDLPWWKLIERVEPDPVVIETLENDFAAMNEITRIIKIKEFLFLHGYDLPISGELDHLTISALQNYYGTCDPVVMNAKTYIDLHNSVPITAEALKRRFEFIPLLNEFIASLSAPQESPKVAESEDKADPKSKPVTKSKIKKKSHVPASEADEKNDEESLERIINLLRNRKKTLDQKLFNNGYESDETIISKGKEW